MSTTPAMDKIQDIYIAFYGRPADPAGQAYWAQQLNDAQGNLSNVINAFANSGEYHERYGHLSTYELVQGLYQQILGREGEAAGVQFYHDEVETGRLSTGEVALAILAGAQGKDADTLANRKLVAERFTDELTTQSLPYNTLEHINAAKALLNGINSGTTPDAIEQLLGTALHAFTEQTSVSFTLDEADAIATPINSIFSDYHDVDAVEVTFTDEQISGVLHIPQVPAYTLAIGERMEIWYVLTFALDETEGNDLALRFSLPTEPRAEGSFAIYPLGAFADDTADQSIISSNNPLHSEWLALDLDSRANTLSFEFHPTDISHYLEQNNSALFADAVEQMAAEHLSWVQAIGINLDIYSEGNAVHSFIYMLE